jgi:hypothetical protein
MRTIMRNALLSAAACAVSLCPALAQDTGWNGRAEARRCMDWPLIASPWFGLRISGPGREAGMPSLDIRLSTLHPIFVSVF